MIACDTKTIAACSLGSGPLKAGSPMFSTTHATNIRHSVRRVVASVAASKIRSHSTGKIPYVGRNGLRNEARIRTANQISGWSLRVGFRIPIATVAARRITV